jgi:beta-N-acetylhexosaminidase
MVAHVRYPQVDGEVASLSPYWLRTALRGEFGFGGVIFSDDLSMQALKSEGDMPARARKALAAGVDMALICNDPDAVDATLDTLKDLRDPASQNASQIVSQARLVALRRRPASDTAFRGSLPWQQAVQALDAAQAPPDLTLR